MQQRRCVTATEQSYEHTDPSRPHLLATNTGPKRVAAAAGAPDGGVGQRTPGWEPQCWRQWQPVPTAAVAIRVAGWLAAWVAGFPGSPTAAAGESARKSDTAVRYYSSIRIVHVDLATNRILLQLYSSLVLTEYYEYPARVYYSSTG